jgi:hypothetical protein
LSHTAVAGHADIRESARSILGHKPLEIRNGVENPPSSRGLDSRALQRPLANRVTKTKRKRKSTSVRQQLRSFNSDLTAPLTPRSEKSLPLVAHQSDHASRVHRAETPDKTYGRDSQGWFPRTSTQCWASTPDDHGQCHLATNQQDESCLSSQGPINDQERDPLTDISLNAMNQVVDQQQKTRESISDTLRSERTGFGCISAPLNHDSNAPAISKSLAVAGNL